MTATTDPRARRSADGERAPGRDRRAQTTIDFATGAGIFLLTVAFVVSFVPMAFEPFTGTETRPIVADRAANQLAGDLLGDPGDPYVLDEACTDAFFAGDPPTDCRYGDGDPATALGLASGTHVNVTLERDGTVVLATGETLADTGSTNAITAQRVVSYDGRRHRLFVRVW